MKKENVNDELTQHAGGTDQWHKVSALFPKVTMTDGVKHLAEKCKAFWLLDAILSHQIEPSVLLEGFQVWQLKETKNNAYLLTCEDGNDNQVTQQAIHYSDFPYKEATIWFTNNVLLLPCEY